MGLSACGHMTHTHTPPISPPIPILPPLLIHPLSHPLIPLSHPLSHDHPRDFRQLRAILAAAATERLSHLATTTTPRVTNAIEKTDFDVAVDAVPTSEWEEGCVCVCERVVFLGVSGRIPSF